MVLVTLSGWLLHHFGGVEGAVVLAFVLGMVTANFVPTKGSCALPPREEAR